MIVPSLPIMIAIAVLLVLALVTPLFCPFFRKIEDEDPASSEAKPLSVILTVHDEAQQLETVIDKFLTQQYNADYQVVVVVDEGDAASLDVLKRVGDNDRLYFTKLPTSSRYLSRKKLAVTIGLRAAKYDWCVLADVSCMPADNQWLASFARYISDDVNLVMGITPFTSSTNAYYRYDNLRTMLYHLRTAQRGTAFSTNQSLVALRKDDFFAHQGFAGNLEYQRAEFELIVNKLAQRGRTALALAPEAWLPLRRPTSKEWLYRHMHCIDSFKSMKRALPFRLLYHADLWAMHIYNLLTIVAIACGIYLMLTSDQPSWDGMILAAAALVAWLLSFVIRCCIYAPVLRRFDGVHPVAAVMLDWLVSWRNLGIRLSYLSTDKYDFMTHRL